MRCSTMDGMDEKVVRLQGCYFRASLAPNDAHDLWLQPAYAKAPHELIDTPRAHRAGRRTVRVDDRTAEGKQLLADIELA